MTGDLGLRLLVYVQPNQRKKRDERKGCEKSTKFVASLAASKTITTTTAVIRHLAISQPMNSPEQT